MRRLAGYLALILLWIPGAALAEDVLVLKSGDLELYNRAVEGVTSSYRVEHGERVTVIALDELMGDEPTRIAPAAPDVVISVGAAATRYAVAHYREHPVVYCMVVEPEKLELTPYSIGISMFVPVSDLLATLRLVSPNIRHIGVLHAPGHREVVTEAIDRMSGFEARLIPVEVGDARQLPRLARRLVMQSDALWIVPGTLTSLDAMQFLLKLSFEHRVPLVADSPAMVRAGALLAVMPDPVDLGRQAARLAGYLLSGEGLPPDRLFYPDIADLAINLRTARTLGIEVPPLLITFASVVIE